MVGGTTYLIFIHVQLALSIVLIHVYIHCTIRGYHYTIDFNRGFWYGNLPRPFTFEGAKLLVTSMTAVEWYKSSAHILFLSQIRNAYAPNQHECV